MPLLSVDPSRGEPLFQQLVDAVKRAVATGALRPGDRLPSVRELAQDLVVNPNTIAKAFRALEQEGVTVSRQGTGTFVADRRPALSKEERRRRLLEGLDSILTAAAHWGTSRAEARTIFEGLLERLRFDEEDER
jgi:GntR family transcriptional regulator